MSNVYSLDFARNVKEIERYFKTKPKDETEAAAMIRIKNSIERIEELQRKMAKQEQGDRRNS